jgi:hypothetical protein
VIDEDEPQRQPAARIQPQVAAISIDVNGRNFDSPLQIDHDLNEPHPSAASARKLYCTFGVRLSALAQADSGTANDLIGPAGMSLLKEPIAATPIIATTLFLGEP